MVLVDLVFCAFFGLNFLIFCLPEQSLKHMYGTEVSVPFLQSWQHDPKTIFLIKIKPNFKKYFTVRDKLNFH